MRVHSACQQSCISKRSMVNWPFFLFFFSKKLTSKNYFFRFHTDGFHPNAVHFADLKEEDILWHYLNTKSVTHMHRIMYELITCFHEFCNYESMMFSQNLICLFFYEVSRVLKYPEKCLEHLTTFCMSTWCVDCKKMQKQFFCGGFF